MNIFDNAATTIATHVASVLLAGIITWLYGWLILKTRFNARVRQATQHLRIAEALQKERQYSKAKDELIKTIELLRDEHRSLLLSQAYVRLGDVSLSLKEYDRAIEFFILSKEVARNVRHATSEDVILLRMGKAYFYAGQTEDAVRCLEDARRIEERVVDHPLLGETYSRLGEVEARQRHSEIAISYYSRALDYHEKIGDRRSVAASRVCLGDLNLGIAEVDQALGQLSAAREEYNELGDFPLVAMLDNKIVQIKQGVKPA